jgi:titin
LTWVVTGDASDVSDYQLRQRAAGGAWEAVRSLGSTATTAQVTGLANGTAYDFEVQASNDAGDGPWSNTATATPTAAATAPGAPRDLAAAAGNAEVALTWAAPASDGGSPVVSYTVRQRQAGEADWQTSSAAGLDKTVTGLVNFTAYEFQVQAVNAIGAGDWTAVVTTTPGIGIGLPTAPVTLTATAGDGLVALAWQAPTDSGRSPITSYLVREWTDGGTAVIIPTGSDALAITLAGKANGTLYHYQVAAQNAVGAGPWSNEAQATPQAGLTNTPAAPTGLAATASDTAVGLRWQAPADNGGSAIVDYTVGYKLAGSDNWTTVRIGSDALSYTVTGLVNGQGYEFVVAAVNAIGQGPWSATAAATPQAGLNRVPSQPLSLQATAGNGEVGLSWQVPADDGGSAVIDYVIQYKAAGEATWHSQYAGSDATVATVRGLVNGTAYSFRVAAVNGIGIGDWSIAATATPDATAAQTPSAPLSLEATAGDGQVGLSWQPPTDNGGSGIVDYVVQYKTAADATWRSERTGTTALRHTITGLVNGTAYSFRVAAVNGIGVGAWSAEAAATPQTGLSRTPSEPRNLHATPGDTQIGLAWQAPASDGGSPVLQYAIAYRTAPDGVWLVQETDSPTTAYTLQGLVNGQAYEIKAAAVNAVGQGPWSAAVTGLTPQEGLGRAPGAPVLTALAGDSQVALSWSAAPVDADSQPVTDYIIEYRTGTDVWQSLDTGSDELAYVMDGLNNGTTYEFRVAGRNAVGLGAWSEPKTATPDVGLPRVPGAPTDLVATPGNAVVGLSWTRPADNGGSAIIAYVVREWTTGAATLTRLDSDAELATFRDKANGTTYNYEVAAVNGFGRGPWSNEASATPEASLADVPAAPTALQTTVGNTQVGLKWTAPADDGGSPVIDYVVSYKRSADSTWQSVRIGTTAVRHTITGLDNGTAYDFRVAAVNAIGLGAWSTTATATPSADAFWAPGQPTGLTAVAGDSQVGLRWTPPADDGGTPITQYAVAYRTAPAGAWAVVETDSPTPRFTVKGLANDTAYDFMVAAVNAVGQGPWSAPAAGITPAAGLGQVPAAPTATALAGDSLVHVSWTAAATAADTPVTGYVLDYRTVGADAWQTIDTGSADLDYTITGLVNGQAYDFRVAGVNRIGLGDWSVSVSARPGAGLGVLPGAPTDLTAVAGNAQVGLSWTAPADDGGRPVIFYKIAWWPETVVAGADDTSPTVSGPPGSPNLVVTDSDATSAVVRDLANGVTYHFQVAAVNVLGAGPFSNEATAVPDAGLASAPGAPADLVATAGDETVGLSWQPPAVNGGSPVVDYLVAFKNAAASTWTTARIGSDATVYAVTGLTNGTAYDFKVAAVNAIGPGDWSEVVQATPDAAGGQLASAPRDLVAVPGDSEVGLAWSAPLSTGGSPVTSYLVQHKTAAEATWHSQATGSDALFETIRQLGNGTAYSFRVAAVNGLGVGPWSDEVTATPEAGLARTPAAPTALTATAGDAQVGLSWAAPASDGGSAVIDYAVSYKAAEASTWTVLRTGSDLSVYTVTGLVNGTAYDFKVQAVNQIGAGLASDSVQATPEAGLAKTPAAPTGLTATAGNGEVGLSWQAPADDGGSPIADYAVEYKAAGANTWQAVLIDSTATRHTVKGLVNGTAYSFRVAAVNGIGLGAWSAEASASPDASGVQAPGQPTELTATPGDTQIGLAWTPPASDGGSPILEYAVAYRTSPDGIWQVVNTDSPDWRYTVQGLVNGQAYDAKVAAVNGLGQGDWSDVVSAVTPAEGLGRVPGAPVATAKAGDEVVVVSWTPAPAAPGDEAVSYVVDWRPAGGAWQTVETDGLNLAFSDLANATTYEFRVSGVNRIGRGDWSDVVSATPQSGLGRLAAAPTGLVATAGNSEVGLAWTAPTDTGGTPVTDYVLAWQAAGGTGWQTAVLGSDATFATIRQLVNGTAYSFKVAAVNDLGVGPWSQAASATPDASKAKTPAAPAGLTATAGNTQVGLSWTAPADDGGAAVFDYAVFYKTAEASTWTALRTGSNLAAYTVTGLANGTAYEFKVAAVNAIGVGLDSAVATATPDASLPMTPGAPTGLRAGAGDTEVGLRWTAPADDGGSPLTQYAVAYKLHDASVWTAVATGNQEPWAVVGGLANGQAYDFKVAAYNGVGLGAWSEPVAATPEQGAGRVPGAPIQLAATPGDGEVGLAWTAPTGNGSRITGYVVAHKASSASEWIIEDVPADLAWATVRGLANGTAYDFKVAAYNGVGVGPWSNVVRATPDASYAKTPAAPADLAAKPGDGLVGLSWTAPVDNGSAVVSYVVFYKAAGTEAWTSVVTGSTATVATVTGLANGTAYEFKVAAVNGIGLGLDSDVVTATPDASYGGVPTAPLNVQAAAGNAQLNLTWTAPTTTGRSEIQAYLVEYREQGSSLWTSVSVPGDATALTLRDLVNGQPYEVRVTAVNEIGPGTPSAVVVATPTYGPSITVDPQALKAGETLTITGSGFNPNESLAAEIRSETVSLGTQPADADGNVVFTWTVPEGFELGAHEAVVIDLQGTAFKAQFTVLPAEIEKTGASVDEQMAAAAGLTLAVGVAFLLYAGRRRRLDAEAALMTIRKL